MKSFNGEFLRFPRHMPSAFGVLLLRATLTMSQLRMLSDGARGLSREEDYRWRSSEMSGIRSLNAAAATDW